MRIIGLTGGSGTGKGTFAALLREKGAGWVDADAVYRTLCAENREMLAALDAAFGGVLDQNGALDRPKLASIVFADPEKLKKLNAITLPYIRAASLEEMRAQGACPFVLYDAPTLFEVGADDLCERIIGVLVVALIALCVVQIAMALLGVDQSWLDIAVIVVFCGFIGYDMHQASIIEPTLPNAVFMASNLFLDIMNIFIRMLDVMDRR